ncbi:hypothetical protein PMAYCL1PPCAC_15481, partial [Pristionchus mayeri]
MRTLLTLSILLSSLGRRSTPSYPIWYRMFLDLRFFGSFEQIRLRCLSRAHALRHLIDSDSLEHEPVVCSEVDAPIEVNLPDSMGHIVYRRDGTVTERADGRVEKVLDAMGLKVELLALLERVLIQLVTLAENSEVLGELGPLLDQSLQDLLPDVLRLCPSTNIPHCRNFLVRQFHRRLLLLATQRENLTHD